MPFVVVLAPEVPSGHEADFQSSMEKMIPQVKAAPGVLATSIGPVVAVDGKPTSDANRYIHSIVFATKADQEAFKNSPFVLEVKAAIESRGGGPPPSVVFEVAALASPPTPKPFVRFLRVTVSDPSQLLAARDTYAELMAAIGQEVFGGKSVEPVETIGLGVSGFDSLEEACGAFEGAAAKSAYERYVKLGECKDVIVKMAVM